MSKHSRRDPPRSWREEIAVVVVSLLASLAGLPNQFAFDDVLLVQQNARVHDLAHFREILTQPYWPPPFNPELYRPIATFIVALQYVIGDGAPLIFRLASYLLYAAVALAVLALGRRLLGARGTGCFLIHACNAAAPWARAPASPRFHSADADS